MSVVSASSVNVGRLGGSPLDDRVERRDSERGQNWIVVSVKKFFLFDLGVCR